MDMDSGLKRKQNFLTKCKCKRDWFGGKLLPSLKKQICKLFGGKNPFFLMFIKGAVRAHINGAACIQKLFFDP